MLVYRYESESGRGPYSASWYDVWDYLADDFQHFIDTLGNAHGPLSHPAWHQDFNEAEAPEMVSGFTCEDKALEWFDGFLDTLNYFDFHLYSFAPQRVEYSRSGKQIRFVKSAMPRQLIL